MTRFLAVLVFVAPLTWAESEPLFVLDPVTEGVIVGSGLGINLTALALEAWNPGQGSDWNLPLDARRFAPSEGLDQVSKALTLTALLAPSALLATDSDQWLAVGTVYAESLVWAWGLKDLGKTLLRRNRPWTDEADSFPSGHTTLAFTGAAFDRAFPGSPWTLPLGVASYGLAAGAAALRVTSGHHYLSDVVAGAVVGTLAGVVVPGVHRGRGPSLGALPGGLAVNWAF